MQLNASITVLSRETLMLTYDKNFILMILDLRGKVSILHDSLTQVQFDIQHIYAHIETLSTHQPPAPPQQATLNSLDTPPSPHHMGGGTFFYIS